MIPARIRQPAGSVRQRLVAQRTLAAKGAHCVDASVAAATVVGLAFVEVVAAFPIRRQSITRRTLAVIIALEVDATVRTAAVRRRALVDVDAVPRVVSEMIPS